MVGYSELYPHHIKFIKKKSLDVDCKMILIVLLSMRNLPKINISNSRLSEETSIPIATLKRKLKLLEDLGYIVRFRASGPTLNTEINEGKILSQIMKDSPTLFSKVYKKSWADMVNEKF